MADDCIEFVGYRNEHGYGRRTINGRPVLAHRAAWVAEHGPIPPGMVVMHVCDNPPCINVEHLRLGTVADNVRDMDRKGRRRTVAHPGERNGNAKLSGARVRKLRDRYASGARQVDLAEEFGISQQLVSRVVRGEVWNGMAAV